MSTQDSAIVSKLLTNVSNGYFPEGFIAEQILPPVFVKQTTGLVGKYSNNHLRIVTTRHAGKGDYNMYSPITVDSDTYSIENHGLYDIITDVDMRNFEKPFDAEVDSTEALTLAHKLSKEYALASVLRNASTITQNTTLTGNNQYDNLSHADSTPLSDKIVAFAAVRDATGMKPNTLIASEEVIDNLLVHESLMDSLGFKYNRTGGMKLDELARSLGVKQILVGSAMYNSAAEGQTDSLTSIWGNDLLYAYIAPPRLRQKTLGFEFRLTGTKARQTYRYKPTMPVDSKGVIVTDNYDLNLLNVECAYLIVDAIA